jgi:guanylate kinase
MNKYKVIAICGKSASGKDTLLHMIMSNTALHEIVSCTTRPPREGEVDGVNYFFMTLEEFAYKDYRGEMLEVSHFRDWCYGTAIDGLDADEINVGVFNPEGIMNLMKDDRVELYVVLVQASDKCRLIRSLNREINPDVDEIVRRYLADKEDFELFSRVYEPDYTLDTEGSSFSYLEEAARDIVLNAIHHWAKEAN